MDLETMRRIEDEAEHRERSKLASATPDQMMEMYRENLRDAPQEAETPEDRLAAQARRRVFFEVVALRFALKPHLLA